MDPIESVLAVTAITEITKAFISVHVKPKLANYKQYFKDKPIKDCEISSYLEKNLHDYLSRTYDSLSLSDTLIGETAAVRLQDVYIPLRIEDQPQKKKTRIRDGSEVLKLEKSRIMILSNGGMGKTTILKMIGLSCIEKSNSCPILINLRKLTPSNSVLDEIYKQFDHIAKTANKEIILQLLVSGRFVILFDGIDEIAFSNKRKIIEDIKDFISKASSNIFIISSREDNVLTSFPDFHRYSILPFRKHEAKYLFNKYEIITKSSFASQLWKEIVLKRRLYGTLISNPILVTMFFNVYFHTKKLPSNTQELINRILDIYLVGHDYSKSGFMRSLTKELGTSFIKKWMTSLAFYSLKKGSPLFTSSELKNLVDSFIKDQNLNCKTDELIAELIISCPVFINDGLDIRWQHKIFQDYLSAEFICNHDRRTEIIQKLYSSSKRMEYYDVIQIISEVDRKFFISCIVSKVLKSFIVHFENSYTKFSNFDPEIVDFRKAITFGRKSSYFLLKDRRIGAFLKLIEKISNELGYDEIEFGPVGGVKSDHHFVSDISLEARILILLFTLRFELFSNLEIEDRSNFEVKLNFPIPENEIMTLDEDPKNLLNNPNDFHTISQCIYLIETLRYFDVENKVRRYFYPDYFKIKSYLEKISADEENIIGDYLLDGL